MEITNCPECAAEAINAGLALWADSDEPTIVFECVDHCGWTGVVTEYWESTAIGRVAAAA